MARKKSVYDKYPSLYRIFEPGQFNGGKHMTLHQIDIFNDVEAQVINNTCAYVIIRKDEEELVRRMAALPNKQSQKMLKIVFDTYQLNRPVHFY